MLGIKPLWDKEAAKLAVWECINMATWYCHCLLAQINLLDGMIVADILDLNALRPYTAVLKLLMYRYMVDELKPVARSSLSIAEQFLISSSHCATSSSPLSSSCMQRS